jgi:hypothetical protein
MRNENESVEDPSTDGIPIVIVTVPLTGVLTVRFLGEVTGVWTHWHAGRSVACTGEETCDPRRHREKTVWKGYAPVEWLRAGKPPTWVPAVLEVTEGLQEYLTSENPRGEVWQLLRAKVNASRVECRGQCVRHDDPRSLRNDVRVEPAVKRLYRSLFVAFGMLPPFGAKQRLAPTIVTNPTALERTPSSSDQDVLSAEQVRQRLAKAREALKAEPPSKNGKTTAQDRS